MNKPILFLYVLTIMGSFMGWTQEDSDASEDYIEFNDRRNVVHGVYLGLGTYFGEIDGKSTFHGAFRVAYVANRQFEVGFIAVGFYSQQELQVSNFETFDLAGGYAGLHVEPILFGDSKINLSFPVTMGAGGAVLVDSRADDVDIDTDSDDWDEVFVVEPGINMLYNLSRYVQLEVGMRYRFSSRLDLRPDLVKNINGFSAGMTVKVGIFNMGRNRYKKHLGNDQ
ncbi:MAG: hypothetical protein AAFQ20_10275 [Bacteroidota bacterium]